MNEKKEINELSLEEYIYYMLPNSSKEEDYGEIGNLTEYLKKINADNIPVKDFIRYFNIPFKFIYIIYFVTNKNNYKRITEFSRFYLSEEYQNISSKSLEDYINYMLPKVIDITPDIVKALSTLYMTLNASSINVNTFRLHYGLKLNIFEILDFINDKENIPDIIEYIKDYNSNKNEFTYNSSL